MSPDISTQDRSGCNPISEGARIMKSCLEFLARPQTLKVLAGVNALSAIENLLTDTHPELVVWNFIAALATLFAIRFQRKYYTPPTLEK